MILSLVITVFAALWAFEGYYLFTAWFPSLYDEITPINGVMAGAFMTLMLTCAVAALLRPRSMIGPSKVLILGAGALGVTLPFAFVFENALVTVGLLVTAIAILGLVIALHPGGTDVRPARRMDVHTVLLVLTVAIAVPFLWMAITLQWSQIALTDDIAQRWFYGGYSMYLLTIVALMVVTAYDGATRRFTAGTAVFLTGMLGLVSVVYPTALHSLGIVGGGLLLVWCGIVGFLTVRHGT